MKAFVTFLFFFTLSSNSFYIPFNFHKNKENGTIFSQYIKLKIDDIPYKTKLVIRKFNHDKFTLRVKPNIEDNFVVEVTDSEKEITVESKPLIISQKNNPKVNNNFQYEKNIKFRPIYLVNDQQKLEENKEELVKIKITDTINKAINYNPKIKSQESLFESSEENIKQIYSAMLPSVDINVSKGYKTEDSKTSTINTNEDRSPQDFSINLEQSLYTGGKFSAGIKKAKNELMIESENLKLAKYEVILDSALAFLDVLEKRKIVELNNLKEDRFKKDLQSIELFVKVGNASQSDLVFAQSKLVEIAAEKIANKKIGE